MPHAADQTALFDRAALLGKGSAASRVLGFVRDALLAYALGGGAAADAFFVAFRLPNAARRLLGEGSLALALIPALTRREREQGPEASHSLARACLALFFGGFCVLTLAGVLLARPLALGLAPGLAYTPGILGLAAMLLAVSLPYAPFAAGAAVSSGLLMARGRFFMPALTPLVFNLALIPCAVAALFLPTTRDAALLLAAGVAAGGGAQWLCQLPALKALGFTWRGPWPLRDAEAHAVLRATPPALLGAAAQQLNLLAVTMLASLLAPGAITALYFAERLVELPSGVIGASLGLAALPALTELRQAEDRQTFRDALGHSLRLSLFCSLPSALGLAGLALPLAQGLFGHGAFDLNAQTATAGALEAYAPALPALAASRPLLAALNALGRGKRTAFCALVSLALTLACGAVLLFCTPLNSPWAVSLAAALGAWGNAALLWRELGREKAAPPLSGLLPWPVLAGCAALALFLAGLRAFSLGPLASLALGVLPGAALYAGLTLALGSEEARLCLRLLRQNRRA